MEALGQQEREIVGHERSELVIGAERAVRGFSLDPSQKDVQRLLALRRGLLEVEEHRLATRKRELELVLDARDGSPRGDPAVALPVDADEDITLVEIRRVEVARRVRASSLLEEDRRQA